MLKTYFEHPQKSKSFMIFVEKFVNVYNNRTWRAPFGSDTLSGVFKTNVFKRKILRLLHGDVCQHYGALYNYAKRDFIPMGYGVLRSVQRVVWVNKLAG